MQDELPPQHGPSGFTIAVLVIGSMAIFFALLFRSAMTPVESPQLGKPFPAIEAAGWINGSALTADDLKGKVFVVDAWAFWCGPCRMIVPDIIELQKKYQGQDVVFLGLTSEGRDSKSLKLSEEFVESLKIPWVNGYGAVKTLNELEVESIPQLWVVGRDNQIVFHEIGFAGNSIELMDAAIQKALAK